MFLSGIFFILKINQVNYKVRNMYYKHIFFIIFIFFANDEITREKKKRFL